MLMLEDEVVFGFFDGRRPMSSGLWLGEPTYRMWIVKSRRVPAATRGNLATNVEEK
jgi:hypothetical protein